MYRIVMPSRKRHRAAKKALAIFPTATITVNESELDDYRKEIPDADIVPHPDMLGLPNVINWCMDHFDDECLVFADDDIIACRTTVPRSRKLTAPDVQTVIENAMQAVVDLDLTTFCFARSPNVIVSIDPINEPLKPTQPVCVVFGVRGAARRRKYRSELIGRADIDWALQTLMEDRVLYCDTRFYFDSGRYGKGSGGNVGLIDDKQRAKATKLLKERWGRHVRLKVLGYQQKLEKRLVLPLRIGVSRKHPNALG